MNIPTHDEVLEAVEAFLIRHDMRPTRFGSEATGEPQLLSTMQQGRSPSLGVLNRMKAFMQRKDAEIGHGAVDISAAPAPSPGKSGGISGAVQHGGGAA